MKRGLSDTVSISESASHLDGEFEF